jgi:hypothetical protein
LANRNEAAAEDACRLRHTGCLAATRVAEDQDAHVVGEVPQAKSAALRAWVIFKDLDCPLHAKCGADKAYLGTTI